jgi:hypothetical protein
MWPVLVRQVAFYLLTRRGKTVFAVVGALLLCFITVILLDARVHLTAGFMGAVTLAFIGWRAMTILPRRAKERERARLETERTAQRAAASEARSQKFDQAKSAVAGAAKTATAGAAGFAKAGISGAREKVGGWRSK